MRTVRILSRYCFWLLQVHKAMRRFVHLMQCLPWIQDWYATQTDLSLIHYKRLLRGDGSSRVLEGHIETCTARRHKYLHDIEQEPMGYTSNALR